VQKMPIRAPKAYKGTSRGSERHFMPKDATFDRGDLAQKMPIRAPKAYKGTSRGSERHFMPKDTDQTPKV